MHPVYITGLLVALSPALSYASSFHIAGLLLALSPALINADVHWTASAEETFTNVDRALETQWGAGLDTDPKKITVHGGKSSLPQPSNLAPATTEQNATDEGPTKVASIVESMIEHDGTHTPKQTAYPIVHRKFRRISRRGPSDHDDSYGVRECQRICWYDSLNCLGGIWLNNRHYACVLDFSLVDYHELEGSEKSPICPLGVEKHLYDNEDWEGDWFMRRFLGPCYKGSQHMDNKHEFITSYAEPWDLSDSIENPISYLDYFTFGGYTPG